KMILAGAHAGEPHLRRFRAEAQALARVQHPAVIQVFDVGEADGKPYYALEFCPGGSLAGVLRDRPLPAAAAARLLVPLTPLTAPPLAGGPPAARRPATALPPAGGLGPPGSRGPRPGPATKTDPATGAPGPAGQAPPAQPKVTDFGLAKLVDDDAGGTRSGDI